ncbi:predicted protein [Ostreococcus lucimarinus CCE9901]|uniref:Secreted protein n=1 Tax=Ostreococcus lucimarinus (strain CCE9901) TaxID=436017 RepID=A4S5N8_OSTLU|nr:predicted protein [Ostreococcus lucimarinus CCE9901]ABO98936.1 predicted protein [Ostreococcus lucimarinus CCE9901]|eukprot:XP_001420643.1 predicted protein [Ostreococcus lucimarinus CCE9901]
MHSTIALLAIVVMSFSHVSTKRRATFDTVFESNVAMASSNPAKIGCLHDSTRPPRSAKLTAVCATEVGSLASMALHMRCAKSVTLSSARDVVVIVLASVISRSAAISFNSRQLVSSHARTMADTI